MAQYKFLKDLTSDVLFEAYGRNEKEMFENSAKALMSIMCQIKKVKAKKGVNINIKARNLPELLFKWLQELIVLVDTKDMFFSKFVVGKINDKMLKAKVYGEPIKPEKGGTIVKAVTYYKFNVEKLKKGFKATVSLDI